MRHFFVRVLTDMSFMPAILAPVLLLSYILYSVKRNCCRYVRFSGTSLALVAYIWTAYSQFSLGMASLPRRQQSAAILFLLSELMGFSGRRGEGSLQTGRQPGCFGL